MGKTIYIVRQLGYLIILSAVFSGTVVADAYNSNCNDSTKTYSVVKGDNLYNIAISFGDYRFWEFIYIANANYMDNPHLIYPGQSIRIPSRIATFKSGTTTAEEIIQNPFCENEAIDIASVKKQHLVRVDIQKMIDMKLLPLKVSSNGINETEEDNENKLNEFRAAFEKLVEAEKAKTKKDLEPFRMEVDGMVLDETISKIGRDFYNVFYQYWSGPEKAYNYTITIAEKPAPSLGTIVTVKVNDTYTYQSRLQPRYELIEEAGKAAVRYSYSHLQRNNTGLTIY